MPSFGIHAAARRRRPVAGVAALTSGKLAANRTQIGTQRIIWPVNAVSRRSHWAHPSGTIRNLRTVDCAWYYSSSGGEAGVGNAITYQRWIEYPVGTFTQVTWDGGATSATIADAATKVSDPLAGLTIPAGAQFFERTVVVSSNTFVPTIEMPANHDSLGLPDGAAVGAGFGNSGTIAADASIYSIGAAAFLGDVSAANARSYLVFGDSIAFGQGDVSGVGAKGQSGYVDRGLGGVPVAKAVKSGMAASVQAGVTTRLSAFIDEIGFTDLLVEHGVNDLYNGRTQAQLFADYQTLYALAPGKRITQATLTPYSTPSDGSQDANNQAPVTTGSLGLMGSINDAIRAKQPNVALVADVADLAMIGRNAGAWSGPYPAAGDGVHPATAKAIAIANGLAAATG